MSEDYYARWSPRNRETGRVVARREPHMPHGYDERIVYAACAFAEGKATDEQQRDLWMYFQFVTGTGDFQELSYRPGGPDGDRATAFAEGMRFAGLQILKLLHPQVFEAVTRDDKRPALTSKEARRR